MQQIKNVALKVVKELEEGLELSTKERQASTEALAKLAKFQTMSDPQLERMKLEGARFITAFCEEKSPYWLSFLGKSGTGKTFLADQIGCRIYPWYEVIGWARDPDKKAQQRFLGLATARQWDNYEGRWFPDNRPICVDDIGSEYITDYSKSKLLEFLNRRENHWTVITANMSLEQISDQLDPRIASRMLRHGSVVVEVDTQDFSLRQ